MASFLGPFLAVAGVTSVFILLTYLLSKRRTVYGFIPSVFLYAIAIIFFIGLQSASQEGFGGLVFVLMAIFFAVCATITLMYALILNRKNIFNKRN